MNHTVTEELQDRLNSWSKQLNLTSIIAVQSSNDNSFDVTINTGEELANCFASIVASMYVSCGKEHREDMAEAIYDLVDVGINKGRTWVKNNEG